MSTPNPIPQQPGQPYSPQGGHPHPPQMGQPHQQRASQQQLYGDPQAPFAQQQSPTQPTRSGALSWIAFGLALLAFLMAVVPASAGIAWLPALAAIVIGVIALVRRTHPRWASIVALIAAPVAWLIAIVVTIGSWALAVGGTVDEVAMPAPTTIVESAEPSAADADAIETEASEPEQSMPPRDAPVESGEAAAVAAGIGAPVTVGDWTFTVLSVGAPVESVGDTYLSTEAQGVYLPIEVKLTNEGSEAQAFMASEITVFDSEAREFEYSTDAMLYGGDAAISWYDEVNPGNTIQGLIYFDMPDGTSVERLEVADGWFGEPAEIALR